MNYIQQSMLHLISQGHTRVLLVVGRVGTSWSASVEGRCGYVHQMVTQPGSNLAVYGRTAEDALSSLNDLCAIDHEE